MNESQDSYPDFGDHIGIRLQTNCEGFADFFLVVVQNFDLYNLLWDSLVKVQNWNLVKKMLNKVFAVWTIALLFFYSKWHVL